ncbi:MAG: HdeA/HdeB family chaperone [Methylocella sp.]
MKKKIVAAAVVLGMGFAPGAQAQVVLDMSLITCKQLIESPGERMPIITAWMAGYFGAKQNRSTIDMRYLERNTKVVTKYCKSHRSETLMKAIEKKAK